MKSPYALAAIETFFIYLKNYMNNFETSSELKDDAMNLRIVDFYYFSGTGNTFLIVTKMGDTFSKNGIKVNLYRIEKSNPDNVNLEHTIGLGFPVAEFSTYDFVWDFVKSLPEARETCIFMVATFGGISGGVVGSMREILKKKGYTPIGAEEIIMPPNIFYIQDEKTCSEKVKKGIKKAEEYSMDLMSGKSKWGRVPVLSDVSYYISMTGLKLTDTNVNQKLIHLKTDTEKCIKCGICVKLCPVGNIEIKEKEYPEHGFDCRYCLRCTSFCPIKAISCPINYKGMTYRAVKANELLK